MDGAAVAPVVVMGGLLRGRSRRHRLPVCRSRRRVPFRPYEPGQCRSLVTAVAGLILGGLAKAFGGEGGKGRVEFDAGKPPPKGEGGKAGGAGAAEDIEDG